MEAYNLKLLTGSGGGSVGSAVTSDTRDLLFESLHPQNFIYQLYNQNTEKTLIEEEAGYDQALKKTLRCLLKL